MATKAEVLQHLETNKDERGIAHWAKSGFAESMSAFGIGLTKLRKYAKSIGKDHALALELWEEPVYEAKVIATLIENPKEITKEQAERQVDAADFWMLSHAYCSCNGTLSKVPFVKELSLEWMQSEHDLRRRCGYLLLAEMAKNKKDKALTDDFFMPHLDTIEKTLQSEENFVKDAMNTVLFKIGQRSKALHTKALAIAKAIGPVAVDYGKNSCAAVDNVKHLSHPRVLKKFE